MCDGFSKTILLLDAMSGKLVARLEGHAGIPSRACFSPDGTFLLTTGEDTKVFLWNGQTGQLVREFESACPIREPIAFTSDSKRFITSYGYSCFGIYDCEKGAAEDGFLPSGNGVSDLAVSKDGKFLFMLVQGRSSEIDDSRHPRIECWKLPHGR